MTLSKEQIIEKFLNNPCYIKNGKGLLSKKFNAPEDIIIECRKRAKELMNKNNKTEKNNYISALEEAVLKIDNNKGTLESTIETMFEPKDDIELARLHKVDLTKYKISTYWSKLKSNGKFTSSILCTQRKVDSDLPLQKDVILKEIRDYIGSNALLNSFSLFTENIKPKKLLANKLLELSIPDLHLGKMAHAEESGQDYDIKIATKRYQDAIKSLLNLANLDEVDTILLPIGNDLFNVDNQFSTTTGGTPQDCDTRFHKMVRVAKELLINTITGLSAIAKVQVLIVPGNHDEITTFMLGEILDAYFTNFKNVTINNTPKLRKYYKYGVNSFMYTHGDKEKHGDLGLIFATEEPQLWADTSYRFVKLGHLHKQKKIEYLTTDTRQGFQIEILPSLSGTDKWHYGKGYLGLKQAKAYLYDDKLGEIANFTYSV